MSDPFDEPLTIPDDWVDEGRDETRMEVRLGGPAKQVEQMMRRWFRPEED